MKPDAAWRDLPDVADFCSLLSSLGSSAYPELEGFLDRDRPVIIARAPGRMDVMGGIADYSGSLVLQLPTREATLVGVQATDDDQIRIVSLPEADDSKLRTFAVSASELAEVASAGYQATKDWFHREPNRVWAAYVAGVIVVLARELDLAWPGGLRVVIDSNVPEGKGVSSSAALEVSTMLAMLRLNRRRLPGEQLASSCQVVENRVVGAPCGIMDQMTSALGRPGELLSLLCQPADVQGFVQIPKSIGFWGIDSGMRHAVSGSDYTSVRVGAFMGYRIIAEAAGLTTVESDDSNALRVHDPRWHGYLANVSVEEFEADYADRLPAEMRGHEFLKTYAGTTDVVTRVDPNHNYAVRQPTAHPIHENQRVRRFADLLGTDINETVLREMGRLMVASHDSYSACGLGSDGTDLLVNMAQEAGPHAGLYGAKITGGGSGGAVVVLGRSDAAETVAEIAHRYRESTGLGGYVFSGSSPGACKFGAHELGLRTFDGS
jgi:L-arabinokinase